MARYNSKNSPSPLCKGGWEGWATQKNDNFSGEFISAGAGRTHRLVQGDLQDLIHLLDQVKFQMPLDLFGNLREIIPVSLWQDDVLNPVSAGSQNLLLDSTHWQHRSSQRHFAGHGEV